MYSPQCFLKLKLVINKHSVAVFDRSTCSKRSKESLFSAKKKTSSCHLLNFSVFRHVFISSLDMFKNCINSYHIDSEQV